MYIIHSYYIVYYTQLLHCILYTVIIFLAVKYRVNISIEQNRYIHRLLFSHCVKIVKKCNFLNVKMISYCDFRSCIAIMYKKKKTCSKTKENVINRKFNVLDVEYRIYFTCEKSILVYFHLRLARVKKWKKIPWHLWNK